MKRWTPLGMVWCDELLEFQDRQVVPSFVMHWYACTSRFRRVRHNRFVLYTTRRGETEGFLQLLTVCLPAEGRR